MPRTLQEYDLSPELAERAEAYRATRVAADKARRNLEASVRGAVERGAPLRALARALDLDVATVSRMAGRRAS